MPPIATALALLLPGAALAQYDPAADPVQRRAIAGALAALAAGTQPGTVAAPAIALAPGVGWFRNAAGGVSLAQGGVEAFSFGTVPTYPETNHAGTPPVDGRYGAGIFSRDAGLYIQRDTYGTFGQATVASIQANTRGGALPQISGYVTPADAGPGGERGSAALFLATIAPPALDIPGVSFDATHLYLPANRPLTPDEIARYGKPGTFIEAFTRGPGTGPYGAQVQDVSADGRTIAVHGWWLRGVPAAGQRPDEPGTTAPPHTAHLGVVNATWSLNAVVGLAPDSYAKQANGIELDVHNRTGAYAPGPLSDPSADMPVTRGFMAGGEGGTSALFWSFGTKGPATGNRRGFVATGIAPTGAAFIYGDTDRFGGTALYSAQTSGYFLRLMPNDGPPALLVDAAGNVGARQVATTAGIASGTTMRIGACPPSPAGLSRGDLWCAGTAVHRVP